MITCPCCGSEVNANALADAEDIADAASRLGLTRAEAVLFLALWRAGGRIMTYTSLMDIKDAVEHDARSTEEGIKTAKKRLVESLKGHPVEIRPVYGIGYSMNVTQPGWNWRDVQ